MGFGVTTDERIRAAAGDPRASNLTQGDAKAYRMLAPEAPRHNRGLQFTESDIEQRKKFVGLRRDDLPRIAAAAPLVTARAGEYVAAFFDFLSEFDESATLFDRPALADEAKRLKREHLTAMLQGEYGRDYVDQRLRLAKLYSEAKLDTRVFLGAYHHLMSLIGLDVVAYFANEPIKAFQIFVSLKKIAFFDMAIIIDVLLAERERTIALQQQEIRELSIPVLQLRESLLLLPIIGTVDTRRARLLTHELLSAIRSTRAKVVVMDITGVAAINVEVANHLIQTVEAARLIGVAVILSGLSSAVARALVELGVELSAFDIVGDLQHAVERSEHLLGYKVVREHAAV